MSVTLTENRTTYNFARTLADYDLHHSGEDNVSSEPNPRTEPEGTGDNPPDWEAEYRRVPPHRPIDHTIDFAYRSTYTNNIERAFLWNMFNGIRIVSGVNRLWRSTGGKLNDSYFRWEVGGEH